MQQVSQWPQGKVNLSGFGLEYITHIGSGHYGSVQLVRNVQTGASMVAKVISLAGLSEKEHENAHQEVCLLQALRHPMIVAYYNSFLVDGLHTLVILMEHCMGGDLRGIILRYKDASEHFPEDQVMTWFAQVTLALQYIHSERVLHRDVKTSNIFLVEASRTSIVKLGDFGISRVLEGTSDAAMSTVGTPYYMSPEVCRNDPYNWKSDVWALGCVLFELCALKRAFESSSLAGLIYRIVNDKHDPIPDLYSKSLCDLISQLLAKSTQSRPSLTDLSAINYVAGHLQKQAIAMSPAIGPTVSEPSVTVLAYRLASWLSTRESSGFSCTFAPFAECGGDSLSKSALQSALETLGLGFSQAEAVLLAESLASDPGAQITLARLESALAAAEASEEARQRAAWARQVLKPFRPDIGDRLRAKDTRHAGFLPLADFQGALIELLPDITPAQLDMLVLMADKRLDGDIDYMKFADACNVAQVPPHLAIPPPPPQQLDQTFQSDWGSVMEPAVFGETAADWGFQTCSSKDFNVTTP